MPHLSLFTICTLLVTSSAYASARIDDDNGYYCNGLCTGPTPHNSPYPVGKFFLEGGIGYGAYSNANYTTPKISDSGTNWKERNFRESVGEPTFYGLEAGYLLSEQITVSISYNRVQNLCPEYTITHIPGADSASLGKWSGDAHSDQLLANIYFNPFTLDERLHPYIGIGAGLARNDLGKLTEIASNETPSSLNGLSWSIPGKSVARFSGRASVGLELAISNHIYWNIGYRFNYIGNFKIGLWTDNTTPLPVTTI
ncbi:MAG: porin family protein [Gammaproteobacteria bacterium]|nr:porin family protein [Gammaproteobacteria bacterium]